MSSKIDLSVLGMPVHDIPVFEEKQGRNWVSYGADDKYGEYLEGLFLGSSIHSAIVSGVGAMIYGEGLDARDREQTDGTREQWLRLQMLLGDSDTDLLKKVALDLKLYGQAYINTIWNRSRTHVARMRHLPVHTMRAGIADSTGHIDVWYYKADWSDRNKPTAIRAFDDSDRTEASRVLQLKRYAPSFHYYGLPDYVGSTGYIELDHEIQAFHLNNIKNGLFPSMMLSFANGIPTDEERYEIERKVKEKFSGADNAGKLLITFNDGADTAPQFTPIATNGSDTMYEYLSAEVTRKVLSGHRVTSPLLFGVRGDGSGFGNNAEELRDSYSLFSNSVVLPFQDLIIRGLAPVWNANGISLDLYFKPLRPADFLDLNEPENAGEQMSANWELSEDTYDLVSLADELIQEGEDAPDGYTLVDARRVDYDEENALDDRLAFASVIPGGKTGPQGKDGQDNPLFKIRYRYAGKTPSPNRSRDFCQKMYSSGKLYRKEVLEAAKSKRVNPGFGKGGAATYDVWLYKGGPRCQHYWQRETYLREDNSLISVNEARRIIQGLPPDERKAVAIPKNPKEVAQWPADMDHCGFHPDNPNKPIDCK